MGCLRVQSVDVDVNVNHIGHQNFVDRSVGCAVLDRSVLRPRFDQKGHHDWQSLMNVALLEPTQATLEPSACAGGGAN